MRGLPISLSWRLRGSRIIPARAGFTPRAGLRNANGKDHPRACGVYISRRRRGAPTLGSSPRVRGLQMLLENISDRNRIIPARAGFTTVSDIVVQTTEDHPRACGVYCDKSLSWFYSPGSSPRVRGLLRRRKNNNLIRRIIPARAGFTQRPSVDHSSWTDHPRACGVYVFSML